MNKKVYILLLIIACVILFPSNILAAESLELKCNSNKVSINETINCDFVVKANDKIGSVDLKVTVPDGLKVISLSPADKWSGDVYNNKMSILNSAGVNSGSVVATAAIKNVDSKVNSADILISDIEFGLIDSNNDVYARNVDDVTYKVSLDIDTTSSTSSPLIPIGIAAGVVALGAIIIVVAKKKK